MVTNIQIIKNYLKDTFICFYTVYNSNKCPKRHHNKLKL